uniref:Putative pumillio RNA binding protein n=1 Tax=Trypanosoma congolense (strain IL3000) TaxID=1068625 RepID=G0UJ17_TRYCI|nr:putative pumillio RNA binding protein [Trypanosoma congolense IL3000]
MEIRDVNTYGVGQSNREAAALKGSVKGGNTPVVATPTPPKRLSNATQTDAELYTPYPYPAGLGFGDMTKDPNVIPNSADCPCTACAQQRSQYGTAATTRDLHGASYPPSTAQSMQMNGIRMGSLGSRSATMPTSDYGHYQQHQQPNTRPPTQHPFPHHHHHVIQHQPYQPYVQPRPMQTSPSPVPGYATSAVTAPTAHDAVLPVDTAEEFHRKCAGRVVELACSAEGRSLLISAMSSQDAVVMDMMVQEIAVDVERVALDQHGCHVLRMLHGYASAEHTATLVSSFTETLVLNLCTMSQHSRRILQTLFERPLIDLQPIINVLAKHSRYLAATQQGCISLMRVFELCDSCQKKQLISRLLPLFSHIALDPFGNYVVQCVIENIGQDASEYVTSYFRGELLKMSCDKYGSNTVEKIVKVCGDVPAVWRLLMDELFYTPGVLQKLIQDNYGNFVVQTIIEHATNPGELKRICDLLRPIVPNSPYATRIEAKMRAALMQANKRQAQTTQFYQQPISLPGHGPALPPTPDPAVHTPLTSEHQNPCSARLRTLQNNKASFVRRQQQKRQQRQLYPS